MPVHDRFALQAGKIDPNALVRYGPLLQVEGSVPSRLAQFLARLNLPIPAPINGWALIDTGATKTSLDITTIRSLGVSAVGVTTLGTAGGASQHPLFPARFRFPAEQFEREYSSAVGVDLSGQQVLGQNLIVLVGRDLLADCVLIYNGHGGFFTLAF
jgi:hypothetical protein